MSIGTFGTFTQARLGIYAATKGLTVTGNNISNINTVGYTRQALDQVSLRNGGADRYQGKYDLRIGNGALIKSISQLRDPYLDIRYRTEMSIVGQNNTTLSGLTSIADIIDEVGKGPNDGDGVIFKQMSDFFSSLQQLNIDASAQSSDTLARASADTLTNLFHFYANKLEELQKGTEDRLKQEVSSLNTILNSIRDLNSAIRKSEIHGDPALEMRDERNNLIDKLSEYVKIDVVYTMEDVGAGQQVEKLTIKLGSANPDPKVKTDSTVLVDGIYARQFELPDSLPTENKAYDPAYKPDDPDNIDPSPDGDDIAYFKYLKADGTGTNDPAEAEQVPNSNYDMSLGKLLDTKGREWSSILSSSVNKMNPPPEGAPTKAVYAFTLGGDLNWSTDPDNPSTIIIDGTEYTIGTTGEHFIAPGIAGNPSRLASFIANELRNSDTYADYDITTDGATILFTAKNPGAVGQLKEEFRNLLFENDAAIPVDEYDGDSPEAPGLVSIRDGIPVSLPLNAEGNYDPDSEELYYFVVKDGGCLLVDYDTYIDPPNNVLTDTNGKPVVFDSDGKPFASQDDMDQAFGRGEKRWCVIVPKDYVPVMGSGPAEAVNLTLTNGGDNLTLTPDDARTVEGKEGDPDKFQAASIITNPDGTKTFTTYAMRGTDWYKTEIVSEYSHEVDLDDNDLYGSIQAFRELLTEAGEFSTTDTVQNVDENALAKRGIPYYRHSLDLLARVFANAFNEANNGFAVDQDGNYLDPDGEALTLAGEPLVKGKALTQAQQDELDQWALDDFISNIDLAGMDTEGYLVDSNGERILLEGEPVQAASTGDPTTPEWIAFTESVKGIDADGDFVDENGNKIQLNGNTVASDIVLNDDQQKALSSQALDGYLAAEGDKMGGNLFSCRGDLDDGEGITAANISVSHSWAIGDVHIVNTFTKLFGGDIKDTTQESNIGHMISLMGKSLVYDPSSLVDGADSVHLFEGSFQDMLISMSSVLGNDQREVESNLDTALTYAVEMDTSRDSVSAVDLNDEAMNLMQYAKSLNAAYRLMTTLDEALERLINNTGVVGR